MKRVRPGWLFALGILTAGGLSAQSTVSRPTPTTTRVVPLPDPTLLLGSDYPKDEYPEYGMIGAFDLPGDNSTGPQDQVSGGSDPSQDGTGSGDQQNQQNVGQGSGNQANAENQQQGGQPGGTQPTGEETVASGEEGSGGASEEESNATAQGVQVAELIMDGNFEEGEPPPPSESSQNVSIGDSAMVIQSSTAQSDVVGSIPSGSTQQADRKVGGSGAGVTNSINRGTERGSDMPEGL